MSIDKEIEYTGETQKNVFHFSMSRYMLYSVLPKIAMVHSGVASSVYFQIAFNINNKEKSKSWQHLKCWKNPNKIAAEIGCNPRRAKEIIKILIELDLLEESLHGKLKMYKLVNDKILNDLELSNFIYNLDKKLVAQVDKSKVKKTRDYFSELNSLLELESPVHLRDQLMRFWVPDLAQLKQDFIEAENTYKGSSLFLMYAIEKYLKNDIKNESLLNTINSLYGFQHSLLIGCSVSSLNRYIYSYRASKLTQKIEKLLQQSIDNDSDGIINKIERSNINQGVVKTMSKSEFYCPICDKEFENKRSIGMHLGKMTDDNHVKFNQLRKEKECPHSNFSKLYEEHKNMFTVEVKRTIESVSEVVRKDEYMKIPCECKMSCKECHLNWNNDFFKDCRHDRRAAFIEEYNINQTPKRETTASKVTPKVKEVDFEDIPAAKKEVSHGLDTAPGLLKHFYDLTQGRSPNWGKECGQIKTQMKKGLTPEEIRITLTHMVRKGQIDLRFFTTSINDALLENRFMNELDVEGTTANLVKHFYEGHGLKVNIQTLVKDVQKVQETINSGLSYEETKYVLDFMIAQKCNILNFIASKRNDAMMKYNQSKSGTQTGFKANPSFFDQDDLVIIRDELTGGRTHINKIDLKYKERAIELAKLIFLEKKFTTRYTAFEWAWRIGLELDLEMYQLGVKESSKETYIDFVLRNSEKMSTEQLQKIKMLKASFEKWLQKLHDKFDKNNITTVK